MKILVNNIKKAVLLSLATLLVLPVVVGAMDTPAAPSISGDPNQPTINWITVDSDPNGVEWTEATASAAFDGRYSHSSVVFDNKMWVMGGANAGYLNDVWYSEDGVTWTEATGNAQWSARNEATTVVFDNKMWLMGGWNGTVRYNDVWYSEDGVTWTEATGAASWSGRAGAKAESFDNKMWIVGGGTSIATQNDVWYSEDGVTWTEATGAAAFGERYQHGLIAFDEKLWVIGGITDASAYASDVWYSEDGITWTEATSDAGWAGRDSFGLVVFDGKMWVNGGETPETSSWLTGDVWSSEDGITWTEATDSAASGERGYHTSLVFDNKIWAISGYSGADWDTNSDVWYTQNNTIEKYKLCWDTTSGGCSNSVMVAVSDGQVVGSIGSQNIFAQALNSLGLLNTAGAVGGQQMSYTLSLALDPGTWYFSVAAITYSGVESELSSVTSVNVQNEGALPGAPNTGVVSNWSFGPVVTIALIVALAAMLAIRLTKKV